LSGSKNRLPPFVPLLITTLDSPAWKAMSHGAKILYVALRRRVPNGRNRAYISQRQAEREIGVTRRIVAKWFKELEHYGFVVMATPGCLGVEGKGKAPHWRLTELGETSRASANALLEPPTRDFLKWDGSPFKKQNPGSHGSPPIVASGAHGCAIEREESGAHGCAITSLPLPASSPPASIDLKADVARAREAKTSPSLEAKKNRPIVDLPKADDLDLSPPPDPFDLDNIPEGLERRKSRLARRANA
jgi:hypothetical protein